MPSSEGTDAPNEGETPAQAEARRFKVQVDGKEMEVEEQELLKGYQRARAAQQRFDEAARMRQQTEQFLQSLQKDPLSVLTNPKLGLNMEQIAEQILLRKLEDQTMTPEQREQRDRNAKLAQYEAQERERQEAEKRQQYEATKENARREYNRQFIDVLGKAGVPPTADTVARMARYLQHGLKQGAEPDLYHVAELVKEDLLAEQARLIDAIPDDQIEQRLTPQAVEKIRKALLKKTETPFSPQPQKAAQPPRQDAPPRLDEYDFWDEIRRRNGF